MTDIFFPYRDKLDFSHLAKKFVIIVGASLSFWSLMGPNPLLIIPAIITLYLLVNWFATDDFPPVILISLVYQWIQVSAKIIYSTITLTEFSGLSNFSDNLIQAYYMSSIALIALGLGIYLVVSKLSISRRNLSATKDNYSSSKLFLSYFGFLIIFGFLNSLRHSLPGLFQFIVAIGYLKWALFFILFYYIYTSNKGKHLLWGLIFLEFLSGFISYFADFKTVIFMTAISYLAIARITAQKLIYFSFIGVLLVGVGLYWTAIKGDYRSFLNQGSEQQVVNVERDQAIDFLTGRLGELDNEDLSGASDDFLNRISYIDYFSSAMAYVPSELPHEDGQLVKNTLMHVFMPRLFYPDKPSIDDSEHLTKYTGVFYSNQAMGVSFSLGYVGDFYVDFGLMFMFIPIFILGLLIGYIHNFVFQSAPNELWGIALLVPMFLLLYKFEISLIKLFGNLMVYWIFFYFLNKFVIQKIDTYLSNG